MHSGLAIAYLASWDQKFAQITLHLLSALGRTSTHLFVLLLRLRLYLFDLLLVGAHTRDPINELIDEFLGPLLLDVHETGKVPVDGS